MFARVCREMGVVLALHKPTAAPCPLHAVVRWLLFAA